MKRAIGFLVLLGLIGPVKAEEVVQTPEILVEGKKSTTNSTTQFKTENSKNKITTLSNVVSTSPGVRVSNTGTAEGGGSISIRGSDTDEVVISYDDIPLNSAHGDGVDLGTFVLENLSEVDVHRSFSSISGIPTVNALSLYSSTIEEGFKTKASMTYGSFSTFKAHLEENIGKEKSGFLIGATYLKTRGDFTLLDDNGTPSNTDDDSEIKRENNEAEIIHPYAKFYFKPHEDVKWEGVFHFIHKQRGVPGFASNTALHTNLSTTDWLLGLKFEKNNFFKNDLTFQTHTYFRWNKSKFQDPDGELGLGGGQNNDNDTVMAGQKISFLWPWKIQNFEASLFYQLEAFTPEDFLATPQKGATSLRHQASFGFKDTIQFEKLTIKPEIWLQLVQSRLNQDDPSSLTPSSPIEESTDVTGSGNFFLQYEILSGLFVEGNIGRSIRFPTFPELFGDRGGVIGNPALDYQKNLNLDAGVRFEKDFLAVKASYFHRKITDLIQFQQNGSFAQAQNVGEAQINGFEAGLDFDFFKSWVIWNSNYTYQVAQDEASYEGRFLVGRPKNLVNSSLKIGPEFFNSTLSFQWVDGYYLDALNTKKVNNKTLWDLSLYFKPADHLELVFEIRNLGDEKIVDLIGFPLPGRSFWGKMNLIF